MDTKEGNLPEQTGIAQRARREREEQERAKLEQLEKEAARTEREPEKNDHAEGAGATVANSSQSQEFHPTGPTTGSVNSTSDQRTVNNVMRHEYRVLSDIEKAHMKEIKDLGLEFAHLLEDVGGVRTPSGEQIRLPSRELSLALTKIEEAVMWAVKHITR